MIVFESIPLWERILRMIWPPYRRRQDAASREVIRQLMDDPSLPCVIDGNNFIANGYGNNNGTNPFSENRP